MRVKVTNSEGTYGVEFATKKGEWKLDKLFSPSFGNIDINGSEVSQLMKDRLDDLCGHVVGAMAEDGKEWD